MRRYETIVILKPSLGEEDNQAVIDRATSIIKDFKGSIIKIDKWGLKKLAYLIKKESQGYYIYILYAGMPAGVDEMERVFRIDDRVMKFLTVKLQDVYSPLPEDEEVNETEETPSEEKGTKPETRGTEEAITREEDKPAETPSDEEEAEKFLEAEEAVAEEAAAEKDE